MKEKQEYVEWLFRQIQLMVSFKAVTGINMDKEINGMRLDAESVIRSMTSEVSKQPNEKIQSIKEVR